MAAAELERDAFADVMATHCAGVAVATCSRAGEDERVPLGLALTSLSAYTAEPPSVLLSIDVSSRSHDPLLEAEQIGVHLLAQDQAEGARVFSSKSDDKFGSLEWGWDGEVPRLGGVLAYLRCRPDAASPTTTTRSSSPPSRRPAIEREELPLVYLDRRLELAPGGEERRMKLISPDTAPAEAADLRAEIDGVTVPSMFAAAVAGARRRDRPAPSRRERRATEIGWNEYAALVARAAAGLAALGVRPGDRAVMMLRNVPDFHVADLALKHLGVCPVSIYNSSAAEQIAYVAGHCRASLAIVEPAFLPRLRRGPRGPARRWSGSSSSAARRRGGDRVWAALIEQRAGRPRVARRRGRARPTWRPSSTPRARPGRRRA